MQRQQMHEQLTWQHTAECAQDLMNCKPTPLQRFCSSSCLPGMYVHPCCMLYVVCVACFMLSNSLQAAFTAGHCTQSNQH